LSLIPAAVGRSMKVSLHVQLNAMRRTHLY